MIMKKTLTSIATCTAFIVAASSASALVNDNFNRPDGPLVGTNPTPGPGGTWQNHSGGLGNLLISGGQAVVQHGVPDEDANVPFADQTVGVLTAVFDIIVNDDTPISGTDSEYFAHFMEVGTFNFFSRIDIVPANNAGDYTLGIATTSGTAESIFPTDFSYGATVTTTLTYDFSTGLSSVTVGATTITSTTSVFASKLNAFALRQSDSSNNETVLVDNLVVSNIPEPTTFALGGLGLLALVVARRRR